MVVGSCKVDSLLSAEQSYHTVGILKRSRIGVVTRLTAMVGLANFNKALWWVPNVPKTEVGADLLLQA